MTPRILNILLRLVLVLAAYAAEFAVFWRYPVPGRLWALVPGSLLATLLVLIRKDQIGGVILIGLTTLLGTVLGFVFLMPNTGDAEDRLWSEFRAAIIGAIVGGIVALVNHERLRARKHPCVADRAAPTPIEHNETQPS
jgi:peptidoglycan/LPS O-acetylase OafA/YrhL